MEMIEHRTLGNSGLRLPALGLGTATFGGGPFGATDVGAARAMVDRCLEGGVTLFDSADAYSNGAAEQILGAAVTGRRSRVILSTKVGLRTGTGADDVGCSRRHLIAATEASLRRLATDWIDVLHLHLFDASTPLEETMGALDELVRAGKVRYLGVSNFAAWQIVKAQNVAERSGFARIACNQAYYSLVGRELEWDLLPASLDQGIGTMVWSPLAWGRLTGKLRRGEPIPAGSRLHQTERFAPPVDRERLFRVLGALETLAAETGKTVPQIAINWLLQRPTVASVLIGARNEAQLAENLGATGWQLTPAQMHALDLASATTPPYPHHQYWLGQFAERNPPPVEPIGHR